MKEIWDVVVIGGGPAGMMAAVTAAKKNSKVLLLEKNAVLGEKLLITGGGRCNVTNAEPDIRKLLSRFKDSDQFLFSAFSKWDNTNTIEFFNSRGCPTKIEAENRVFPASNSAVSIWNVLIEDLKKQNVTVRSNTPVKEFIINESNIEAVELKTDELIYGKSFILATGGKSRPETGSTGDGFVWLKEIGHTVVESSAALVPITVKDEWVKRLAGISLNEAKVTMLQNNTKQDMKKGKILFTHVGLSGPAILNMSRDISELLKYGEVILSIDLLPHYDPGQLNQQLQDIFKTENTKKLKNSLGSLVPTALAHAVIEKSGIDGETSCHSISRENRLKLVEAFKDMRTTVSGLMGVEKAVVTSGGVSLEEIDFKTMQSTLFPNLYIVGDLLNIDRPSGGYSLQLCWTTGFVAGTSSTK